MNSIISGEVLFNVIDKAVTDSAPEDAINGSTVFSLTRGETSEANKTIRIDTNSVLALHDTNDVCDYQNVFYIAQCFVLAGEGLAAEYAALKTSIDMALEIRNLINNNPTLVFEGSPQVHLCSTFRPDLELNIDFLIVDRAGGKYGSAYLYGVINPT